MIIRYRRGASTCVAALILLVVAGCSFAERVYYIHEPSQEFIRNYDFDDDQYSQYIVGSVLLAGFLTELNYGEMGLEFIAYSTDQYAEIEVVETSLSSHQSSLSKQTVGDTNLRYELNTYDESRGLYKASIEVAVIAEEILEKLAEKGEFVVTVKLVSRDHSPEESILHFKFARRTERYLIQR